MASPQDPPKSPPANPVTGTVDHDQSCARCSYNLKSLPVSGVCPECGAPVRESLPYALTPELAVGTLGTVDSDRSCIRCAYNLRGLPIDGLCPECATPVRDSLKGILLQYASPDYLAKVARGLKLILNGILLMVAVYIGSFVWAVTMGPTGSVLIMQGLLLVASIIMFTGYWFYTEPDPGFAGTETPGSARNIARNAALAQIILLITQTALLEAGVIPPTINKFTPEVLLSIALSLASVAAWATQFFAILKYTGWAGRRVPDAYIVRRTSTYMWLLPVLSIVGMLVCGLGPMIALVLYWNLLDRLRKHLTSIKATGNPAKLTKMV